MARKFTDAEVDAFMRQFKLLVVAAVGVCIVPFLIYVFYLDNRLDSFEDSLRYRPPHEISSPVDDRELEELARHPVQGQVVYVPAYSHIYQEDGVPCLLTITLSVRNTSSEHAIILRSVRYFDTNGRQVKSYLAQPVRLGPLATSEFLIEREDTSGGSGANFLVEWLSREVVSAPVIEAVMIDMDRQQGISFARNGVVVREILERPAEDQAESEPDGR